MPFTPLDMLLDFCWMGLLLASGKVIRAWCKPVQWLYLPSSVIAGLLGLFLGPEFLDWIPFSGQLADYPWLLVVVLFASLPFSSPAVKSPGEVVRKAGSMFCFNMAAEVGLFGLALLLGASLFSLAYPSVSEAFPLLLPAGFVGGHGYAAAIGGTLEKQYGFQGALSIGYTFATIGLLSAILVGIPLIKWATRKGLTRFIRDVSELPPSMRSGLLPETERKSMGKETVSASSLDPLAYPLALILISAMCGFYLAKYSEVLSQSWFGRGFRVPDMAAAMICGLLIKKIMGFFRMGQAYLDRRVATRIGGTVTDWLVGFGMASVKIAIVTEYIGPILFMCAGGLLITLTVLFLLAPRMNPRFWFERGIFVFGWTTGVVAMGITLLRVVDPDYKSGTLEAYGLAYTVIAPVELLIIAFVPMFIGLGYVWGTTLALLGLFLMMIGLSVAFGFWSNRRPFFGIRDGEREIIEGS